MREKNLNVSLANLTFLFPVKIHMVRMVYRYILNETKKKMN